MTNAVRSLPTIERALFNIWAKEHKTGFALWVRKSDLQILAALRSKPGLVEILGGYSSSGGGSSVPPLKKHPFSSSLVRPLVGRQIHTAPPLPLAITDVFWNNHFMEFLRLLESPFVTGISSGTLSEDAYQYFMHQEERYLHSLSQTTKVALSHFSAELPTEEEKALKSFFERFKIGIGREIRLVASQRKGEHTWPIASVCKNYSYWQRSLAEKADLTVLLFGLISCLKIYYAIGRVLYLVHGSGANEEFVKHRYYQWIREYGSPHFSHSIYLAESVATALYARIQRGESIPFSPLQKDRLTRYETGAPQIAALLSNAYAKGFRFDQRFLEDVSLYIRQTCPAETLNEVRESELARIKKWSKDEDQKLLHGVYHTPWGKKSPRGEQLK